MLQQCEPQVDFFCPESEVALNVSVQLAGGEGARARLGLFC